MPYRLIIYLTLSFLTLIFTISNSQTKVTQDNYARFKHLTIDDGLPGNMINSIFQDKDRYVWIGTEKGLSRYDGNYFKNFYHDPNDSSTIPDNFVVCIKQDSLGHIWAGTKNGLAFFDKNKNCFCRIPLISETGKGITNNHIRYILPDKYPYIWVETIDGNLHYLNSKTFESKIYPHTRITQPYYNYHTILKDSYNKIWIGGRNLGTAFFDTETKTFTYIQADPTDPTKKRDYDVACYFEDSKNRFWVTGTDGFYLYDRLNDIFEKKLATSTFQIAEDNNKDLWLATGGGLYRYTPEKELFVRYRHNESDPFSISSNHQYCLIIDADGNIWTGTAAGINILLKNQTYIKHYRHIPNLEHSLNNNKVTSFFELNDSVIYIGTAGGGMNMLNTKSERFKAYTSDSPGSCPISANTVSVIKGDKKNKNTLWVGLWRGIGFNRFDTEKECFTRYAVSPNTYKVDWYNDFYDDGSDTLWCGIWGGNGIHFFDKKTGKFLRKNFQPRHHPDNSPLYNQFSNGDFMITTNIYGIIYLFDNRLHKFNGYVSNTYSKSCSETKLKTANIPPGIKKLNDGITFGKTTILLTDKGMICFNREDTSFHQVKNINYPCYAISKSSEQHSFWTGTEKGLEYYNHDKKEALVVENNTRKHSPLHNRKITSLYLSSKDRLYVGTDKGLLIYNPLISDFIELPVSVDPSLANSLIKKISVLSGNKITFILNQGFAISSTNLDSVKVFTVSESPEMRMPTDIIFDITQDGNNNDLFFATNIGIMRYSPDKASFSIVPELKKYMVHSLGYMGSNLSLCTDKGYLQYIPETDSVIHYNYPPSDLLSSHLISFLHEDHNGYVWAGSTDRGVNRINPKTGRLHHYFEELNNSFTGKDALCFLQTKSGRIYVGGEKLNLYAPQNDKFIIPEFANRLPDEPVIAMLEDKENNLWFITLNNILKYTPYDSSMINIKKSFGLGSMSFTGGALKQNNGKFLIGTKQGFLQFTPTEIKPYISSFPVQITGVSVFSNPVTPDKKIKNGIRLNYDENFLKINFSSMNYSPVETTYEYMLKGVDEKWVKTISPSTSYTKIQPGKYLFMVRNADDPEHTLSTFRVIIEPPFWKTWWFISLLIIAVASIVVYWWKQRLSKVKTMESNLRLRQRLLLAQLNPHFIFNILTAIQSYVYQNNPQEAGRYLSKFAKLMRLVLENMRNEHTPVEKEINTLTYYLEMQRLRFNNAFDFKISTSGIDENTEHLAIPTMILQPLIENAVEHGMRGIKENGKISIEISLINSNWEITVEDNGKGYDPGKEKEEIPLKDKKHKSLSTRIIRERIEGFNRSSKTKEYKIRYMTITGKEQGTKVVLTLPVIRLSK